MSSTPNSYQDGFGNEIPDEDLLLRKKLLEKLQKQFSRNVLFEGNARTGTVKYTDGNRSFSLQSEMCPVLK